MSVMSTSMIFAWMLPIANILEPAEPLLGSCDRPFAAPGGANNDRALTGPHNGIAAGEFVEKAYPVTGPTLIFARSCTADVLTALPVSSFKSCRDRLITPLARATWPNVDATVVSRVAATEGA